MGSQCQAAGSFQRSSNARYPSRNSSLGIVNKEKHQPNPFKSLNAEQRRAIECVNGKLLILAGAGSGKTSVLTLRMLHLIQNLQVPATAILGLTFTNKAAAEMRHRIASYVQNSIAKQLTLCTFHSFCMQVLRCEIGRLGYTSHFSLYNEGDVLRLIRMIARDILDHESELPSLVPTVEAITKARNKGLSAEEISGTGSDWHDGFTQTVYQRLQESLRAYNAVDFDHLLSLTVQLFEEHPDVLETYQERYRYIMIDEYQDTNPVQYRLASLLSAKYQNLCVVGDDDQSIYGWRGADVRNILEFNADNTIKLEQNYRSTNNILRAANAVISGNRNRYQKALWSDRGEGIPIEVFHAPDESSEAEAVVCRIALLKEQRKLRWKDFAILYRSNILARAFEIALMKHSWHDGEEWVRGVPYQVFGGTEFYERREIKDFFAYLRVIVNPLDQEALLRIINQPRRGIGEQTLDAITAYNRKKKIPLWDVLKAASDNQLGEELQNAISERAFSGIKNFIEVMTEAKKRFEDIPLAEAAQWLVEKINYRKAIEDEVKSTQMRAFKWENLQDFISMLSSYQQKMEEELDKTASLHDFITTFPLETDKDRFARSNRGGDDKVNLLTFHSAKGLEFPVCFLVGMESHIMPHEKSVVENGVEEERRLMYVALTRAKERLTISMARKRKRMGKNETPSHPSPFLFDIPNELIKSVRWDELPTPISMDVVV